MSSEFKHLEPLDYFRHHLEQNRRPDGRKSLTDHRSVSMTLGVVTSAEGSALVKQGNTVVVCGVRVELAPTKVEEPDKGQKCQYSGF